MSENQQRKFGGREQVQKVLLNGLDGAVGAAARPTSKEENDKNNKMERCDRGTDEMPAVHVSSRPSQ